MGYLRPVLDRKPSGGIGDESLDPAVDQRVRTASALETMSAR
jgi:hypothetical protein